MRRIVFYDVDDDRVTSVVVSDGMTDANETDGKQSSTSTSSTSNLSASTPPSTKTKPRKGTGSLFGWGS
jgi:hypothetical protein